MAIGFHYDDIEWESYENDLKGTDIQKDFETAIIAIPTTKKISYIAEEDGIREVIEIFDQEGQVMPIHGTSRIILPKEVFLAAYNAYIKEGE